MTPARRPLALAGAVSLGVLAVYLATLAPTVTFWDAGEFLAAIRTLGIPHPPGSPLFILVAHLWGAVVPFGEYAWRINLLSAVASALAAGCWCLVARESVLRHYADVERAGREIVANSAGVAAAALTAFGYTTWQNATETEVYSLAMLLVALVAWSLLAWREHRRERSASRFLLLALFLGSLGLGIHLIVLLVGPALIAALAVEHRKHPPVEPGVQAAEQSRIAVVAAVWLLLIGAGLGSAWLVGVAMVLALIAGIPAIRRGEGAFLAVALVAALVGISTSLFLFVRAHQAPWLNEAQPSTWHALLDVIRRAQYPVRTPFDDPTVRHGAGNPGRTLQLLAFQVGNFAQYFDWQWANGIRPTIPTPLPRLALTLVMAAIGLRGARAQRQSDPTGFAFVLLLFLVAGPGLVVYMNFKPGPSIGWEVWTELAAHEVRERDYFFVASFVAWGVWVAIGLAELVRAVLPRLAVRRRPLALSLFAIALIPVIGNWRVADRRTAPDATFARDFARALLQSVPPGGILFTEGDNDTFPLWYAQAVEGVRPDVTVVCLALTETAWYQRQLRDLHPAAVDRDRLAGVWRGVEAPTAHGPLYRLDDATIAAFHPFYAGKDLSVPLPDGFSAAVPSGAIVSGKDFVALEVLRENAGRRPVAWSITTTSSRYGLGPHLVQQGLALVLPSGPVDSARLATGDAVGPSGAPLDVETTARLAEESWQYGRLLDAGVATLEPSAQVMAATLAQPLIQAGVADLGRGDTVRARRLLRRAERLSVDSIARTLRQLEGSHPVP